MPGLAAAEAQPQVALELRLLALESAVPLLQAVGAADVRAISRRAAGYCRNSSRRSWRCSWRCSGPRGNSPPANNPRFSQGLLHERVQLGVVVVLTKALQERVDLVVGDLALLVDAVVVHHPWALGLLRDGVVHGVQEVDGPPLFPPVGRQHAHLGPDPAHELSAGLEVVQHPEDLLLKVPGQNLEDCVPAALVGGRVASGIQIILACRLPALDGQGDLVHRRCVLRRQRGLFELHDLVLRLLGHVQEDPTPRLEAVVRLDVPEYLPGRSCEVRVEEPPQVR